MLRFPLCVAISSETSGAMMLHSPQDSTIQIRAWSALSSSSFIFPYLSVLIHHLYMVMLCSDAYEECLFIPYLYRAKDKWAQHLKQALSLAGLILPQLETEKKIQCKKIL